MALSYFIYARKSSESEDKQVASIDSQITELKRIAESRNLVVTRIFTESFSGKAPGRPIFNEMMSLINRGVADGIICWKINRLTRNPIDGATVLWALQQNVLKHIVTMERDYDPKDNVMMMYIELGMANQFIKDLSFDTRRGLKTKIESGWWPHPAPIGYSNDPTALKGHKTIQVDPEAFSAVRHLWEMKLSERYTFAEIFKEARKLGLTHHKDKPIGMGTVNRIFTNQFYLGKMKWHGEYVPARHTPMITQEEFNRVQLSLSKRVVTRGRPRADLPFRKLIRCGHCGAQIGYTTMTKPSGLIYSYYRCTRHVDPHCPQGLVKVDVVKRQIDSLLKQRSILREMEAGRITFTLKDLVVTVNEYANPLQRSLLKNLAYSTPVNIFHRWREYVNERSRRARS